MSTAKGLSRRDLLKLGALGSAALLLPVERMARTQLSIANRLPASRIPAPFSVAFATPPVLTPVHRNATTDFYDVAMEPQAHEIIPGLQTTIWGYNGITP